MVQLDRYFTLYFFEAERLATECLHLTLADKLHKLHSLKGTAKALQLEDQVKLLFEMEESVKDDKLDQLTIQLDEFSRFLNQWKKTFRFDSTAPVELSQLGSQLEPLLRSKKIHLMVEKEFVVPRRYESALFLWLSQMAQNAATHGFGSTHPHASFSLAGSQIGNEIGIRVEDNGQGIDILKLSKKAPKAISERLKKIVGKSNLSEADLQILLEAICVHKISTLDKVQIDGGRGVGLSGIRGDIERLGGTLKLINTSPLGTVFEIRLPG